MNFSIELTSHFKREAKQLYKKYPSLKVDLAVLIDQLEINPLQGIALGNNVYKVRLAITSKGKGKSGGARVMTFVKIQENRGILFFIYDKGDRDSLSKKEIQQLTKGL